MESPLQKRCMKQLSFCAAARESRTDDLLPLLDHAFACVLYGAAQELVRSCCDVDVLRVLSARCDPWMLDKLRTLARECGNEKALAVLHTASPARALNWDELVAAWKSGDVDHLRSILQDADPLQREQLFEHALRLKHTHGAQGLLEVAASLHVVPVDVVDRELAVLEKGPHYSDVCAVLRAFRSIMG